MPQALDEILAQVPFFEGMGEDELALIAGCGRNVHFDTGETIFRQGDAADTFLVIRHGAVAVGNFVPPRGELVIETLEAGDLLGWSWLFPPYRSHFDARALSAVRATQFDGACLRDKCAADPAFGYDLMSRFAQVLIERLQWTRLRLLDIYGGDGR
jgi:CRP-like cAMP-binding protein